jgi:hypothetical protein
MEIFIGILILSVVIFLSYEGYLSTIESKKNSH